MSITIALLLTSLNFVCATYTTNSTYSTDENNKIPRILLLDENTKNTFTMVRIQSTGKFN